MNVFALYPFYDRRFKRRKAWLLFGVLAGLMMWNLTLAQLETFTTQLDERVPRLMNQYGIPGASIALITDGEIVWSHAYGYADLEHQHKMNLDAVYRVESISKSVTAWGVMKLVQQGLIDLDAPMQTYLHDWQLPASPYSEQKVTARRLLSNSAGMPLGTIGEEYSPGSAIPTLRDTLRQEATLMQEPGVSFSYSNTGFHVLELLIEEVTGRDFAEYMANEILLPLEMDNATFAWDETLRSRVPSGYDLQGKPVPVYVYPAKASGGLFATLGDIARFVNAEMTGSYYKDYDVLSQESLRKLYAREVTIPGLFGVVADGYGFGHFTENLPDGQIAVWHGGQGHGWMTHFHAVPESGDGIVILTNSQRSWPLMAQVLSDWARWNGLGIVKMGRITYAAIVLRVLIIMIVLGSLSQVYRLIRGVHKGKRKLTPFSRVSPITRLIEGTLGIAIIAALIWSTAQPYLIVSSVFPSLVGWAGGSLLLLALTLLASALFPKIKTERSIFQKQYQGKTPTGS